MLFKTHVVFGLLFSLIVAKFLEISNDLLLFILISCVAAVFPDIDNSDATQEKRHKLLTKIFQHRGFMHTIFPPMIISGIIWYIGYPIIAIAILTGYFSHLLIDAFTKMGINFLHPFSTFRIAGFIKTGGILEFILFLILVGLNIFYMIYYKPISFI